MRTPVKLTVLTAFLIGTFLQSIANDQSDSLFQVGMDNYNQREYLWALGAFRLSVPGFKHNGDREKLAKTYAYMGFIMEKLGSDEMANRYFDYAIEHFDFLNSQDMLHAIVLGMSGMYEQSNQMLQQHLDKPSALNWLGQNMRSLGNLDSALYYYKRAQAGADEEPRVWPYILIGDVLTDQGKYTEAIENYSAALSMVGDSNLVVRYTINTAMGNAYLLQEEYQKSVDFLLATRLPPRASSLEVAKRNNELLQKAYTELNMKGMETNINLLKMAGLMVVMFLVWFFLRQRKINNNVTGKLGRMYAKYLDLILERAMVDLDQQRPADAKEDIALAREVTRKIKEN